MPWIFKNIGLIISGLCLLLAAEQIHHERETIDTHLSQLGTQVASCTAYSSNINKMAVAISASQLQ